MICSFKQHIYPRPPTSPEYGGKMVGLYNVHGRMLDLEGNVVRQAKVVGYYLPTTAGIKVDFTGNWTRDKYGIQYEADNYREIVTPDRDGIIAYLSSGLLKGVGPKTAERIYNEFGDNTLDVLDKDPDKLMTIRGISQTKLERLVESYLMSRGARDVVSLLAPHGVGANRAVKIFKKFKGEATTIIRQYPYRLCDMHGIGFTTADSIAMSMGLDPLSSDRIAAGVLYALTDAETEGHLCIPSVDIVKQSLKLLDTENVTHAMVSAQLSRLFQEKQITLYRDHYYRTVVARVEQDVADELSKLIEGGNIAAIENLDEKIDAECQKLGISLAIEQWEAIKVAPTSRICIISGGPGTGKTLIQRVLLSLYSAEYPDGNIFCCAPTGRAARRMSECSGYPASTIHSTLGMIAMGEDEDEDGEPDKLIADLVLVDEVSMLDIFLARRLLAALPDGCRLVLVGDADQLPSVGPGAVLSEMIASDCIPTVRLTKVYRQDEGSLVATNAARIRQGESSLEYGESFVFINAADTSIASTILERLYIEEVERVGVDNIALLTPLRVKTETSVNALNEVLRDRINPASELKPEAGNGRRLFRLGDKVMQIKNKNDISNGDIGYITDIDTQDEDVLVHVDYGDDRTAEYTTSQLDLLDLAYASTVHKSQGSEYNTVLINLQTAHYKMLKRPLIYTAVTRAKERVIIVGQKKALHTAVKCQETEKRATQLAARIKAATITEFY